MSVLLIDELKICLIEKKKKLIDITICRLTLLEHHNHPTQTNNKHQCIFTCCNLPEASKMTGTSSSLGRQIEVQKHSTKEMEKNILRIILTFIHFINTSCQKFQNIYFK